MPRQVTDPKLRTGLDYQHLDYEPDRKNDCAARAWAKVTGEPYASVYAELSKHAGQPIERGGTPFHTMLAFGLKRGWVWKDLNTLSIVVDRHFRSNGCASKGYKVVRKLLTAEHIPANTAVVAITPDHAVAVVDHVIYDSFDCRGKRSRRLQGYFFKPTHAK